jgi:hypothetical protein
MKLKFKTLRKNKAETKKREETIVEQVVPSLIKDEGPVTAEQKSPIFVWNKTKLHPDIDTM